MNERDALREYAQEERARRSLFAYCCRVIPGFMDSAFARHLCGVLEQLQPGDRVIVTAPPGHGKSTIAQAWGAWMLGRRPESRLLTLSASEALAVRNSKVIRSFIQDEKNPWSRCKLKDDSSSVSAWETTQGNSVRTFGAGSTITGFRAEIVTVDDAQADEGTGVTRDSLEQWFRNVLSTRLEPDGIALLIQTRWSTDDLVQRLLDGESGAQWRLINFEAINESGDDPLGRDIGAALWPERWDVDTLLKRKAEVGSGYFETAYQGHPIPAGGRIFRVDEWFRNRYDVLPAIAQIVQGHSEFSILGPQGRPPAFELPPVTVSALDAAQKENIGGSYSALCTVTVIGREIYVVASEKERAPFDRLLQLTDAHCTRHGSSHLIVEDAAMGSSVISTMKGRRPYAIVPVSPTVSKELRAMNVVPTCERGEVRLPARAPWLDAFVTALRDFPQGRASTGGPDEIDAFVWAVMYARKLQHRRLENQRTFAAAENMFVR